MSKLLGPITTKLTKTKKLFLSSNKSESWSPTSESECSQCSSPSPSHQCSSSSRVESWNSGHESDSSLSPGLQYYNTAALVEMVRFLFWKTLELSLPKQQRPHQCQPGCPCWFCWRGTGRYRGRWNVGRWQVDDHRGWRQVHAVEGWTLAWLSTFLDVDLVTNGAIYGSNHAVGILVSGRGEHSQQRTVAPGCVGWWFWWWLEGAEY